MADIRLGTTSSTVSLSFLEPRHRHHLLWQTKVVCLAMGKLETDANWFWLPLEQAWVWRTHCTG